MKKSKKTYRVVVNQQGRLEQLHLKVWPEIGWIILLLLLPLAIITLKLLFWPQISQLGEVFTIASFPPFVVDHVQRLMLMSLGAVVVVFFRLTLGIRVLGPVRPILIAVAYQITGFAIGTIFLVSVMIIMALIRPLLRNAGMPYFARIAIVLNLMALFIMLTLKIGLLIEMEQFVAVGLLPVVVLTFAAEGFAKTLYNEGIKSASWRALMTILVAALIKVLVGIPVIRDFTMNFPETLVLQIGLIYLIARFMNFRLLHTLNPVSKYTEKSVDKLRLQASKKTKHKKRLRVYCD